MPPHIQRLSPARWRPVNMWGHPFYQWLSSVVSWVPPHIHRPQIFRCLHPGPHQFPCSSMHWTYSVLILGVNVYSFCPGCPSPGRAGLGRLLQGQHSPSGRSWHTRGYNTDRTEHRRALMTQKKLLLYFMFVCSFDFH